jgi:peptidoglycan/LPS O-acetylase OafA/YrhL
MANRNTGLDVLRCLAVIVVVNAHTASTLGPGRYLHAMQLGGVGVDLFFVLSGWLLGQQLLRELRTTGRVEVRRFWYRRWMRTLPAYFAVLALTFLWHVWTKHDSRLPWSYFFFGQNYLTNLSCFSVSWSLCVEEHFYLAVAPVLFALFRFRHARYVLPAFLLLPAVCRYMGWYHSLYQTHVRYDECAAGVLLASCKEFRPQAWRILSRFAPVLALAGAGAACYNVVKRVNPSWGGADLPTTLWCLIFAAFVLFANVGSTWLRGGAAFVPVRYLAERSYAVYLLHPDALAIMKHWAAIPPVLYFSLAWVLSLAFAEVLYRAVERPFMRAREWFSSTAGRREVSQFASSPVPASSNAQALGASAN